MTNQFCKALSNRILFTNVESQNSIKYKPCCFFSQELPVDSKSQFEAARKLTSLINNWTPFCQKCKNFEDNGIKSARLESNEEDFGGGIDLEIQMDKTCNAACITCGEWSSTTWTKYNKNINNLSTKFVIKPDVTSNVEKITSLIDFNSMKINSIHILGGEPFANDSHLKILNQIPDHIAKDIELTYTTKGSYPLDDTCLSTFKKFKEVEMSFSFDGVGDVFNYHRWPLIWSRVEEIFESFLLCKDVDISCTIGTTLTAFNIFYYNDLEQWASKLSSKHNKSISLDYWPAFGVMSLAGVPPELRTLLSEKYSTNPKLINYISSQPYTQYAYTELLKHVEYHDSHRKLSWKDTFPDVVKYFK